MRGVIPLPRLLLNLHYTVGKWGHPLKPPEFLQPGKIPPTEKGKVFIEKYASWLPNRRIYEKTGKNQFFHGDIISTVRIIVS